MFKNRFWNLASFMIAYNAEILNKMKIKSENYIKKKTCAKVWKFRTDFPDILIFQVGKSNYVISSIK